MEPAKDSSRRVTVRWLLIAVVLLSIILLLSCTSVGYVAQSLGGGAGVLLKRERIDRVLERGSLDEEVRHKLELVLELRQFAESELKLPVGRSYGTYVELDRPYVTWNVVAAPQLSISPEVWCFPIAGCVSYRGYFKEERAHRFAAKLQDRGMDVAVGGVTAYSTLGWFADPVLSTFLPLSDLSLAGLLFHELAHQQFYLAGDTAFNESFASAVELIGEQKWLEHAMGAGKLTAASVAALREVARRTRERERTFVALVLETQRCLQELYRSDDDDVAKSHRKAEEFDRLRARYQRIRAEWVRDDPEAPTYDRWFAQELNNAHIASVGDYSIWVDAFLELERQSSDLEDFYERVAALGNRDREFREQRLRALSVDDRKSAGQRRCEMPIDGLATPSDPTEPVPNQGNR